MKIEPLKEKDPKLEVFSDFKMPLPLSYIIFKLARTIETKYLIIYLPVQSYFCYI